MEEKQANVVPTVVIASVLLALPLLYAGSYLALSDPYQGGRIYGPPGKQLVDFVNVASYRIDAPLVKTVFTPANRIDRWLRPQFWERTPPQPFDPAS